MVLVCIFKLANPAGQGILQEADEEAAEVNDTAGDAERAGVDVLVLLGGVHEQRAAKSGWPSRSARTANRSTGSPSSPTHTGTCPCGTCPPPEKGDDCFSAQVLQPPPHVSSGGGDCRNYPAAATAGTTRQQQRLLPTSPPPTSHPALCFSSRWRKQRTYASSSAPNPCFPWSGNEREGKRERIIRSLGRRRKLTRMEKNKKEKKNWSM